MGRCRKPMVVQNVFEVVSGQLLSLQCQTSPLLSSPVAEEHLAEVCSWNRELTSSEAGDLFSAESSKIINVLNMASMITVSFNFLAPLNLYRFEKPYHSRLPSLTELKRTNITTQRYCKSVLDVSGYECLFNLDDSGFEFAKFPIDLHPWNEENVLSEYIPKMTEWLQQHLGSSNVFVYAYNVCCFFHLQM